MIRRYHINTRSHHKFVLLKMQFFSIILAFTLCFSNSERTNRVEAILPSKAEAEERNLSTRTVPCGKWELDEVLKGAEDNDFFGSTVATSANGKIFAVGAPRGSITSSSSSYVKVFEYNVAMQKITQLGTNYELVPKTTEGLPIEKSGSSISLSENGKTIAIANVENENPSETNKEIKLMSGGVTVYSIAEESDGSYKWNQLGNRFNLHGEFLQTNASVKLSKDGSTLVFASSGSGVGTHGKIKVYKYNVIAQDWFQKGENAINERTTNKFVSDEVSVTMSGNGNIIAVGSSKNSNHGELRGRVRVFEYNESGNRWDIQEGAAIFGSENYELFGHSMDMSSDGMRLFVGSVGSNASTGKVKAFKYSSSQGWTQVGSDLIGPEKNSYFGASISLSAAVEGGYFLAIGAYGIDHSKGGSSVYHFDGQNWAQFGTTINGMQDSHYLGASVALSSDGKRAILGSPLSGIMGLNSGAAYVVKFVEEACPPTLAPSVSLSPSASPSVSLSPIAKPSEVPTSQPSTEPTRSVAPTSIPTITHSKHPSLLPSSTPTFEPTTNPSSRPSALPTVAPSEKPTTFPTTVPTVEPTNIPSLGPSALPTTLPTNSPSHSPTLKPTHSPSDRPSSMPSTLSPTDSPTKEPSPSPTKEPSPAPTKSPSKTPSITPTVSHRPTAFEGARASQSVGSLSFISGVRNYSNPSIFVAGVTAFASIIVAFV